MTVDGTSTCLLLKSVNSVPVDTLKPLKKSGLNHGNRVRVEYKGKVFSGVTDLESDSLPMTPEQKIPSSP